MNNDLKREIIGHSWWGQDCLICLLLKNRYKTPALSLLYNHNDNNDKVSGHNSKSLNR